MSSHCLVHCCVQIFQKWGKILAQKNFITSEFWCGSSLSGVACYVANTELVVLKRTVHDLFFKKIKRNKKETNC
jgi:hypothetical protein